jgi:hypothetical protein
MSDEDFVTGEGRIQLPNSDDVEEMLEILMKIAKFEGAGIFGISAGHGSHGSPQPAFSADISLALAAQTSILPIGAPSRMARRIAGDALSKGVEHPTMSRFS